MAWLAVNDNSDEMLFKEFCPIKLPDGKYKSRVYIKGINSIVYEDKSIKLQQGTIELLLGRRLYRKDEPVEILIKE